MRFAPLNLARRPFLNTVPVMRTTIALWILGTLLLITNVLLYWRHFLGQGAARDQLVEITSNIAHEQTQIERLAAQLDSLDVDWQNRQVKFLNTKIAERTFSWSELFDRLGEVLPEEVHLRRVAPQVSRSEMAVRGNPTRRTVEEAVYLAVTGVAKTDTSLLELVDALFAHPSFFDPNLSREAKRNRQEFEFVLSVVYLPGKIRAPDDESIGFSEEGMTGGGG